MLEKIVNWGKEEEAVKALILLGSRARDAAIDPLSDYDIALFCDDEKRYSSSDEWLSTFGKIWVCVKETILFKGKKFPSRLVIYEGGIKGDFNILTSEQLDELVQSLPDEYNLGYKVLLDKENKTAKMTPPQLMRTAAKPSEQEFHRIIDEFWFEAYHVAVYLQRGELWVAKSRSWAACNFLLRMLEWDAEAENNWQRPVPRLGKKISSWCRKEQLKDLKNTFSSLDTRESTSSLLNAMALFTKASRSVAQALQYPDKNDLSQTMTQFISNVIK